jgi:hypothetical protein
MNKGEMTDIQYNNWLNDWIEWKDEEKIICAMCRNIINESNMQPNHIISIKINNIKTALCRNCFTPIHYLRFKLCNLRN